MFLFVDTFIEKLIKKTINRKKSAKRLYFLPDYKNGLSRDI